MRSLIYSLLVLVGCGPIVFVPPIDTTACGLHLRGDFETGEPHPDFDFGMLTRLEQLTIKYGLADCRRLKDYNVWVRPAVWDQYNDQQFRAGQTFCNPIHPRIEIAATRPDVVIHELHHVEQGCDAPGPVDPGWDAAHADWDRTGAFKRIETAKLEFKEFLETRNPKDGGL